MIKDDEIINGILKSVQHANGQYNFFERLVWFSNQGKDVQNVMVSIHEYLHEYLNRRTIYGILIEQYAQLFVISREEKLHQIFNQFVNDCREIHEIYATYIGVETMKSILIKGNLSRIGLKATDAHHSTVLNGFEKKYLDYYYSGEQLVKEFRSVHAKSALLNAIAVCCLQTKDIALSILKVGFENFNISSLPLLATPQNRLTFFKKNLCKVNWKTLLPAYGINYELAISIDLADKNYEVLVHQLYRICSDLISREQVISSMRLNEQLELADKLSVVALQSIGQQKKEKSPKARQEVSLVSLIRKTFLNERIFFTRKKRPAELTILSNVQLQKLITNSISVAYFLIHRNVQQLKEQLSFDDIPLSENESSLHSHFFICSSQKDTGTVCLYKIDIHALLAFVKISKSLTMINLSFEGYFADVDKLTPMLIEFLKQNSIVTFLLDISPYALLELAEQEKLFFGPLSCCQFALQIANTKYFGLAFIDKNEKVFLLAPCSLTASVGFVNHLREEKNKNIYIDDNPLKESTDTLLGSLMSRIVKTNYTFAFNKNK